MRRRRTTDLPEIQIAPMIDCVFLMLVYFMTTSSLEKSEADLPFPAGVPGAVADPLPAVDEQTLSIPENAFIEWNGSMFNLSESDGLQALVARLNAFRETCAMAKSEPSLRVLPDAKTPHQVIVTLLDSITKSGIEKVHFP